MKARRYTNNKGISLAMAVWLARDEYQHDERSNVLSVSSLLKSTRSIILTSRLEAGEGIPDISMLLASRMGTSLHNSIESAWVNNYQEGLTALGYPKKIIDLIRINPEQVEPGQIPIYLEKRSERKVGKWIISGQFDMVCDGFIMDVKSTSVQAYLGKYKDDDYIKQCSMYRWLNTDIITKDHLKIQFIFKDWSLIASYSNPNYPSMPVFEHTLPLMELSATEQYIRNKLRDIEQYWDAPESVIPECSDKELWVRSSVWKYYGKLDAKRATKSFDNPGDANLFMATKGKGFVKEIKGNPTACTYCNAAPKCGQYAKYKQEGIIKN